MRWTITARMHKEVSVNYAQKMEQNQEARNKHQAQLENTYFEPDEVPRHKLDLLYQIAYDYGHAHGWNEIAIFYGDMAELVKR